MADGFDRYTGTGNDVEHEAGYDAYMTGVIYIAFIAFIHEKKGLLFLAWIVIKI